MEFGPYRVTVDRHQVLLFRDHVLVGTGRWTGTTIEELNPPLLSDSPSDDAALLTSLAEALAQEEAAAIAEINAKAYDANGIDLTLIEWILGMTPRVESCPTRVISPKRTDDN